MKSNNRNSQQKTQSADIAEYISALKSSRRFGSQVVYHHVVGGKKAQYAHSKRPWPESFTSGLDRLDINRLYSHQVAATDEVRRKRNIIVSTPTASGKSLIYNLPVFEEILLHHKSMALYLFPLKALAQDQLRAIKDLAEGMVKPLQFSAAIYDGDTSAHHRRKIRQNPPRILITNPDMLHLSLLGYHEKWSHLFSVLTHVILDEVHTYKGIFGSHMAWVLRRMNRICRLYKSDPLFLLSSATVGNPEEMAEDLLSRPVFAISKTGAPQGKRHFLFINPMDSPAYSACLLLEASLHRGLRTIVYTQSRKIAELIYVWTKKRLGKLAGKLSSYRAGYLADERREIEAKLSTGELLGVVSTSALELGIDIGTLDICILVGYPGTVMTTWQRSGRVGRSSRESLTILIAQEDALDQYFMRHPADFFKRDVESAVLNPDNRTISKQHLACAAAELPISIDDPIIANKAAQSVVLEMADKGALLLSEDGSQWFGARKYPHREINLRGSGRTFVIRSENQGKVLGEIDAMRCMKECHPGAIYLHRGLTWLVKKLDLNNREVLAARKNVHYFTKPLSEKRTNILDIYNTKFILGLKVSFGSLRVTDLVTGFQRRLVAGHKLIATDSLDLPPSIFETEGLWIEIAPEIQSTIEKGKMHFMGGIHAVEHILIGMFPLLVLCDRNDVGGIACPFHEQLPGPGIFIYDGYPGGVGLSAKAFEKVEELLRAALDTLNDCECEIGCPSCVHSPKCGSGNRPMDKAAACHIIHGLLQPNQKAGKISGEHSLLSVKHPNDQEKEESSVALPGRYGVLDLETKRSADEVGGWHRADRMGISVAILYDSKSETYHTYLEQDISSLIDHLQKLDLLIGFNIKRFDNRVLSAYTPLDLNSLPILDMLEEIKNRLGYRLSLDRLAEHTLGEKKSASGLQALEWYKEGNFKEIITYCQKDVEITRKLYLFGFHNRYLLFNNKAGKVVRLPVRFRR